MLLPSGNAIKSIQRGVIATATSVSSATATITAVDTTKSMVNVIGIRDGSTADERTGQVILTNATTVTAYFVGNSNASKVSFEVIEFY